MHVCHRYSAAMSFSNEKIQPQRFPRDACFITRAEISCGYVNGATPMHVNQRHCGIFYYYVIKASRRRVLMFHFIVNRVFFSATFRLNFSNHSFVNKYRSLFTIRYAEFRFYTSIPRHIKPHHSIQFRGRRKINLRVAFA